MKYKHIEAARELRLWIGQVIVPVIAFAAGTLAVPEIRNAVSTKINNAKQHIKNKLKRDLTVFSLKGNLPDSF